MKPIPVQAKGQSVKDQTIKAYVVSLQSLGEEFKRGLANKWIDGHLSLESRILFEEPPSVMVSNQKPQTSSSVNNNQKIEKLESYLQLEGASQLEAPSQIGVKKPTMNKPAKTEKKEVEQKKKEEEMWKPGSQPGVIKENKGQKGSFKPSRK